MGYSKSFSKTAVFMWNDEIFDVVDENNRVIGAATRSACHSDPSLMHRVAHVLVFDNSGRLILQKRSPNKDIQPGKWDTSVGGHLGIGEKAFDGAKREMKEELGIDAHIEFMYSYIIRTKRESEMVFTYFCMYNGKITHDPEEISYVKKWTEAEVERSLGKNIFTNSFEKDFSLYRESKWSRYTKVE